MLDCFIDLGMRATLPRVDPKLQTAYASLAGALIYEAPGVRIDENQTIAMLARAITFPTDQLMLDAVRCLATRD